MQHIKRTNYQCAIWKRESENFPCEPLASSSNGWKYENGYLDPLWIQGDVDKIGLLPLLMDSAHSPATVKHAMQLIKDATLHLHPGQVPVIVMDQPLYNIAKQIQWEYQDEFGEDNSVVMLSALHIEMSVH